MPLNPFNLSDFQSGDLFLSFFEKSVTKLANLRKNDYAETYSDYFEPQSDWQFFRLEEVAEELRYQYLKGESRREYAHHKFIFSHRNEYTLAREFPTVERVEELEYHEHTEKYGRREFRSGV